MSASHRNPLANLWHTRARSLSGIRRVVLLATIFSLSSYGVWTTVGAAPSAAPQITSLSAGTATRSGRVLISGTGFGATQNGGRVEVGGVAAHVSRWSDTLITAYVAEVTPTGSVPVQVVHGGGTSDPLPLEVTLRPAAADRVRWRFTVDADYAVTRPALGADGTVYVNDVGGALYALAPDGALKWVYRAGLRGGYGPVSVGADGTVYVASLVPKPDGTLGNVGAIHAVNPDGTEKWVFKGTGDTIIVGPNVGPDGNVYAVTDLFGIGLFSLSPAGGLRYQRGRFFEDPDSAVGQEIVFGPDALYFGFDSQSRLHSYSLGGDLRWSVPAIAAGVGASFQAAVGPNGNLHVTTPSASLAAYDPQGSQLWSFNESPNNLLSAPAVGSDNAAYVVRNRATLHAVNPGGTARWSFSEGTEIFDPAVSPANDLVFMGGRASLSGLSFFQAVSAATGQSLWKVLLAHEPGFGDYGQIFPSSRPLFSADGRTAYIAADIMGDGNSSNVYSYFYAVDTTQEGAAPNTAPTVRVTSPAQRESFAHLSDIAVTAEASDAEGPVAKVEFYRSSRGTATLVGTDTTAPYSAVAEDVPGDNYALYAVAYDEQGLRTESEGVFVKVDYWPPTAELTSPANGAWFPAMSDVTLTAQPNPRDGRISRIEFIHENGETICTVTAPPYTCVWQDRPAGVYTVFARTFDDGTQHVNSQPVTFAVGEGQRARYTISGDASAADGTPIGGVTVTLERGGRMQPITVSTTTTDASGHYSFENLEPHYTYDVEAYHEEFSFQPSPTVGPFVELTEDKVRDLRGRRPEPRPEGAPPVAWASYYGSPERLLDGRTMLALDGQGNAFVVGDSGMNFAVVKYDPAGRQLWARVVDGGGSYQASAYDIGTDAAGSVYVTGQMWAGTAHERDWVTIKFDAAGNELWRRDYNGPSSITEYPSALEIDAAGNVYVAGEGGAVFSGGRSIALVKYDTDGNVLWSRFEAGGAAQDVKLDAAGNAYVIGVDGGRAHVFKYDPAGNLLWTYAHSTGSANEQASVWSVYLGGDGGVYVLADVSDPASPTGGMEPVVLKVNAADGQLRWVSFIGRKNGQRLRIATYAMDVDPAGNAYVVGIQNYQTDGNVDAFTLKVGAADGAVQWMDIYAEPTAARWNADNNVVVDAAGNAYSYFTSMRAWDDDIVIVKYRPDGTREWVHLFDNKYHSGDSSNDLNSVGRSIMLDARGDIIFTGDSEVPGHSLDFVTVKLAQSPSANAAPTVVVTSPTGGASFDAPADIALAANATDGDGTISRVEFIHAQGGELIGADTTAPYTFNWSNVPAGTYEVRARAFDNDGASAVSDPVAIRVGGPLPPRVNYALPANGGAASASSVTPQTEGVGSFPASAVNNGDRKGLNWNSGGWWRDATEGAYPDWVQLDFAGQRQIDEIDVFTAQDAYLSPSEPREAMTFTQYGVSGFRVEYWTGTQWQTVPNGVVTGNDRVWRKLTFPAVTTDKVRVVITGALAGRSRLVELEAWGVPSAPSRVNHALATSGATTSASSVTPSTEHVGGFPVSAVNNGDRKGLDWDSGGWWRDATEGTYPDWVEVNLNGPRQVDEIDVFTAQDAYTDPSEPDEALTFTRYGVTAFEVLYWDGSQWLTVPGGSVTGNDRVWRKLTFPAVTTDRVRVFVTGALAGRSRLVEVEAWGPAPSAPARVNVAAAASGATATASTTTPASLGIGSYSPSSAIDGERLGAGTTDSSSNNTFWRDATDASFPDWLQVQFAGQKTIGEVDLYMLPDDYSAPSEPTAETVASRFGLLDFEVQYWAGAQWQAVPGGAVTNNDRQRVRLTFPSVTTDRVRVVVNNARAGYSRIVEFQAWTP